ncbi:30S ribosomal protein S18 [bacterium]|nr:MAG: 30S ribosomal protein S18 [bacterium]
MKFKAKTITKKRESRLIIRKKFCRFCAKDIKFIDYKDIKLLEGFIRERGKIISARVSGNCAKHQRRVTEAINKARFLSLVPYSRV